MSAQRYAHDHTEKEALDGTGVGFDFRYVVAPRGSLYRGEGVGGRFFYMLIHTLNTDGFMVFQRYFVNCSNALFIKAENEGLKTKDSIDYFLMVCFNCIII